MDGIDISGAEKCMGVPVAAQPVGQADTCVTVAPHGKQGTAPQKPGRASAEKPGAQIRCLGPGPGAPTEVCAKGRDPGVPTFDSYRSPRCRADFE